ncbi:unnamed protein product [Brassica oleracea]
MTLPNYYFVGDITKEMMSRLSTGKVTDFVKPAVPFLLAFHYHDSNLYYKLALCWITYKH